jgi:hypothetical protein
MDDQPSAVTPEALNAFFEEAFTGTGPRPLVVSASGSFFL